MIPANNPMNTDSISKRERISNLREPKDLKRPISFFRSNTLTEIRSAVIKAETVSEITAKMTRIIETREIISPTS